MEDTAFHGSGAAGGSRRERRGRVNPPGNPALDPFRLKGGAFTLLVLEPIDLRAPDFFRRLMDRLAQAPNFYRNAPIVVDLAGLAESRPINFAELANRLRQHRLIPVGVMNATAEQAQGAANAGLALLPSARPAAVGEPRSQARSEPQPPSEPQPIPQPSTKPIAAAQPAPSPAQSSGTRLALVIVEPVRAGSQIYAEGRDLVLLSSVSPGPRSSRTVTSMPMEGCGAARSPALAEMRTPASSAAAWMPS